MFHTASNLIRPTVITGEYYPGDRFASVRRGTVSDKNPNCLTGEPRVALALPEGFSAPLCHVKEIPYPFDTKITSPLRAVFFARRPIFKVRVVRW